MSSPVNQPQFQLKVKMAMAMEDRLNHRQDDAAPNPKITGPLHLSRLIEGTGDPHNGLAQKKNIERTAEKVGDNQRQVCIDHNGGTVRPALTAGENINLPRSLKPADEPHHQIEEDHRGEHRKSDKEIDSRGAGPIDFSRSVEHRLRIEKPGRITYPEEPQTLIQYTSG